MRVLVFFFVILPFVELGLLFELGERYGFLPTIAAILGVGMVGAAIAKREGLRVIGEWNRALAEGRAPEEGVLSSLLVLVGAGLFVLPGLVSDVLGLLLLFPPTRRLVAALVLRRFERARQAGTVQVVSLGDPRGFGGLGGSPGPRPGPDVIDVVGEDVTDHDAGGARPRLPPET